MKLRVWPLTLTAALSAALLFGGWFAYRHYGVEQPLDRIAASVPGVQSATTEMRTGEVVFRLKLKPDADLSAVYHQIKSEGGQAIGSRKIELSASADSTSALLDKAWGHALFDVAEAMETHKYSGVRDAMDKLSDLFPGVTATTGMDEDNVYVSLRDGATAKFVVLPREAARMGVWPSA